MTLFRHKFKFNKENKKCKKINSLARNNIPFFEPISPHIAYYLKQNMHLKNVIRLQWTIIIHRKNNVSHLELKIAKNSPNIEHNLGKRCKLSNFTFLRILSIVWVENAVLRNIIRIFVNKRHLWLKIDNLSKGNTKFLLLCMHHSVIFNSPKAFGEF